jgi:hypothetical protein
MNPVKLILLQVTSVPLHTTPFSTMFFCITLLYILYISSSVLGKRFFQGTPPRRPKMVFYQPKTCSKCQHFIPNLHSSIFDQCSLYRVGTDGFDMAVPADMWYLPVTAHMEPSSTVQPYYMYCQEVRERPDMCGEFGKDFRPKSMSDSDDEPPTSDPTVST